MIGKGPKGELLAAKCGNPAAREGIAIVEVEAVEQTMVVRRIRLWAVFGLVVATACASSLPESEAPVPGGTSRYVLGEPVSGHTRSYLVHVPAGYDGVAPLPMVVMLHGAFSSAQQMEEFTGLSEIADREGFVAVYPNGIGLLGLLRHWNSGQCCAKALRDDLDDVGFIAGVMEEVGDALNIDQERVYIAGHSNGGMMAYRFAAERSHLLAAAAAVSATIGGAQSPEESIYQIPPPQSPLPMLVMHGRADEHIPYDGGNGPRTKGGFVGFPVTDSVAFWVEHNGCEGRAERILERDGAVIRDSWCANESHREVILYTLEDWPHSWPGPYFTDQLEPTDPLHGYDGSEVIWDFFERHSRELTAGDAE